jgi:hypothetical protein
MANDAGPYPLQREHAQLESLPNKAAMLPC